MLLHNEAPGITLCEDALRRMERAGAEGRKEGVKMAQELLLELMEMPKVQGVYLMPSFGRHEVACEVLDVVKRPGVRFTVLQVRCLEHEVAKEHAAHEARSTRKRHATHGGARFAPCALRGLRDAS